MKPKWRRLICWLGMAGLVAVSGVRAAGILIPSDKTLPPLAIRYQRVDIKIRDGAAVTAIEQVFVNHTSRDLEALYIFPLPENAAISDFAMTINGERMQGELVEKEKARRVYEDIVRRLRDPALLEYMGANLFRVRVFPVPANGEQKIEIRYAQTLSYEAGLYTFAYPLKTGQASMRTLEDFTVSARIGSSIPIKTVYSPSHDVDVIRPDDHTAVVGFEAARAALDRDFVLYYGVSEHDLGLHLLTHAAAGEDGYFMMMLAPRVLAADERPLPKDVVFVLDTSGSMSGPKIAQARRALEYGIHRLQDDDRFNVIRFSTGVESLSGRLLAANAAGREQALEFVKNIAARGGTAIDAALQAALEMDFEADRPAMVVFLTDGQPTVGETSTETIMSKAAAANRQRARLFTFGVGHDVNTLLLDRLASEQGGVARYVLPEDDIEIALSRFIDAVSYPVLAAPRLHCEGVTLREQHPRQLPDLFGGQSLFIFGRYQGSGKATIRIKGEAPGKLFESVHTLVFPEVEPAQEFIPRLWATRRIGFLLEAIRATGENVELKDEIIRLGSEYGVMTPYTSYLVLENEAAYKQHGIPRASATEEPRPVRRFAAAPSTAPAAQRIPIYAARSSGGVDMLEVSALEDALGKASPGEPRPRLEQESRAEQDQYLRRESGADAVELSSAIRGYQDRRTNRDDMVGVRNVGRRQFFQVREQWIDSRYRADMPPRRVQFGSAEYFSLLETEPELLPFLALGQEVIVVDRENRAVIVHR